jgi:hypothetical protein
MTDIDSNQTQEKINKDQFLEKILNKMKIQEPKYCVIYHNSENSKYNNDPKSNPVREVKTCSCGNNLFYNFQGQVVCSNCFKTQFVSMNYWEFGKNDLILPEGTSFDMLDNI